MKKHITILICSLIFAMLLIGCGGSESVQQPEQNIPTVGQEKEPTAPAATDIPDPTKIAAPTDAPVSTNAPTEEKAEGWEQWAELWTYEDGEYYWIDWMDIPGEGLVQVELFSEDGIHWYGTNGAPGRVYEEESNSFREVGRWEQKSWSWRYEDGMYHWSDMTFIPGEGVVQLEMYSEDGIYWYEDGELFMVYDEVNDSFRYVSSSKEALAYELLKLNVEELKNMPHLMYTCYTFWDEEYKSSLSFVTNTVYDGEVCHSASEHSFRIYKSSVEEEYLAEESYVVRNEKGQDSYSYDRKTGAWTKKTEAVQEREDILDLIRKLEDVQAIEQFDEEDGSSYIVQGTLSNKIARELAEASPYVKVPNATSMCQLEFDENKKLVSFYIRIYLHEDYTISGLDGLAFKNLTLGDATIEGYKQEKVSINITTYMYDEKYELTVPAYVRNAVGELDKEVPAWVAETVPCYDFHANLFWYEGNRKIVIPVGKEGWYFDTTEEEDNYVVAYVDASDGTAELEDYVVSYEQSLSVDDGREAADIRAWLPSWARVADIVEFEHNGRRGFYYVTTGYNDLLPGRRKEITYFVFQDIGYSDYVEIKIHNYHVVTQEEAEKNAMEVIKNFLLDM